MRLVIAAAMVIVLAALLAPQSGFVGPAQAQECTGENCPPPSGQGRGRDCERDEDTVS